MGESGVHTAKRTEVYTTADHSPPKAKVLFICGVSRLSYPKYEQPGYIVSLLESDSESMVFSVASDRYCLTEEEESGFNEIRKRLLEPGNQKSFFTNNGWKYVVHHKVNVTQIYTSTNTEYNLGFYNATATMEQGLDIVRRFKLSDPHDSYVNLIYDNGDECATTGRPRTTNVHLVCPSFSVLTDIAIETKHCHYEIYTSAAWVCSLPWMKNTKRATCDVICYDISDDISA
ncbi:uncharacterized protein [Blastocystis hominis]|uniref:MRH domain-containing protein n=1 Tax=Blastocystis hominis TaxID=12968 RepID=D8M9X7_BLAHO|nr:uncharacterized protein [Blastocystis hominis]CBK24866.2 unnamed protein product [Blastocystis hominis]|eukprot:XP_012898914.1 uncharacterized protein [Blastocystis hominis]